MTPKEIAEKSWTLWNDYYKYSDKSSDEILTELIADMEALKITSNHMLCDENCIKKCSCGADLHPQFYCNVCDNDD